MKTLKNLFVIAMLLTFSFSFTSCTEDDEIIKKENVEKLNTTNLTNATDVSDINKDEIKETDI